MIEALLLNWADKYCLVGMLAISVIGMLGWFMIVRDMKAEQTAAIQIANWVYDARRVEEYACWSRVELDRVGTNSKFNITEVTEVELIAFDELCLRSIVAKEIDLILRAQEPDTNLFRRSQTIQASIERRRARIRYNQQTPGVAKNAMRTFRLNFASGTKSSGSVTLENGLPADV